MELNTELGKALDKLLKLFISMNHSSTISRLCNNHLVPPLQLSTPYQLLVDDAAVIASKLKHFGITATVISIRKVTFRNTRLFSCVLFIDGYLYTELWWLAAGISLLHVGIVSNIFTCIILSICTCV